MMLTNENYYSPEANRAFFSSTQIKQFMDCEARAFAELEGSYNPPGKTALLVGGYVDAHFANEMHLYRAQHPEIFTRSGELRAEFRQADEIIARLERDELAMRMMDGQKQPIFTGEIGGEPFKTKLDFLLSAQACEYIGSDYLELFDLTFAGGAIVDLKIMRDFEPVLRYGEGRLNFIEAWRYDLQMAIQQELVRQKTGRQLPCFILAATKESVPDIGLFQVPQPLMDASMEILKARLPRFAAVKYGKAVAENCGRCDLCKQRKVLTGASWPEVFA